MKLEEIEKKGILKSFEVSAPTLREKMLDAELQAKDDEIRMNELERLILLNEKKLINRDYAHENEDYWDAKYEEIERLQGEIDEIRKKLEKGSR
jgi:hypothetical protein